MYQLIFLIIYTVVKQSNAALEVLPKGGYKNFTIGHESYVFHKDEVTWQQAKERCAGAGAELWVPADGAEQRAVGVEVARIYDDSIWTGINDLNNPGAYSALDGRPLSIDRDRWYPGEPYSSGGGYRCVALSESSLYVVQCAWPRPSLCRLPAANISF